jgi:hypothetical protein
MKAYTQPLTDVRGSVEVLATGCVAKARVSRVRRDRFAILGFESIPGPPLIIRLLRGWLRARCPKPAAGHRPRKQC